MNLWETHRWHDTNKLISHAVQIVSGESLQKAAPDFLNILTFKPVESSKEEEVKEWWQVSCKQFYGCGTSFAHECDSSLQQKVWWEVG